jgi:hypothetical protein
LLIGNTRIDGRVMRTVFGFRVRGVASREPAGRQLAGELGTSKSTSRLSREIPIARKLVWV